MRCSGPWILIWEELHRVHQEGILLDVAHVKAHGSKKEKQKIDALRKKCHGKQRGRMRWQKMVQCCMEDEEEWDDCDNLKPNPKIYISWTQQWKLRGIARSGVQRKEVKTQGKCEGPRWLERHGHGKKSEAECRKCSGNARVPSGAEADEPLEASEERYQRIPQKVE